MNQKTSPLPKTLTPFLWHFIKPQIGLFAVLALGMTGWSLQESIYPYFFKLVIDNVSHYSGERNEIFASLSFVLVTWAAIWILIDIGFRLYDFVSAKVFPRFQADIRSAMFDYVLHHSHQYFSDNFAGTIASKISRMTDALFSIVTIFLTIFFPVTLGFLITSFILFQAKPFFGLLMLAWFLIHILLSYLFTRHCARYSGAHSEAITTLNGKIVDALTNIQNIRLFSNNFYEKRYFLRYQNQEIKKNKELLIFNSYMKLSLGLISLIFVFTMVGASIYAFRENWITIGELTLILSALGINGLAWYMSMHFVKVFEDIGTCKEALSLIEKPHDIIDIPHALPIKINRGEIVFDNVSFHYTRNRNIFKDKTLTLQAGKKVGLVGFSGSGKTTFVNLILRNFDVESGCILIDGQDIKTVSQESLRSQIALIPQDTSLFHRSLMENIRYGKLDATDEEVIAAAKKAHCHEFIQHLEVGYNTLVGERGIKLSGGQRQRIAIARAILKDSPILILDEATSSLDSVTEKTIQNALKILMQNRTSIVIAHRLSTLAGMDRILVFKEGQVIEDGTHEALIAAKGHYALLWNMQAGGFLPESLEFDESDSDTNPDPNLISGKGSLGI